MKTGKPFEVVVTTERGLNIILASRRETSIRSYSLWGRMRLHSSPIHWKSFWPTVHIPTWSAAPFAASPLPGKTGCAWWRMTRLRI